MIFLSTTKRQTAFSFAKALCCFTHIQAFNSRCESATDLTLFSCVSRRWLRNRTLGGLQLFSLWAAELQRGRHVTPLQRIPQRGVASANQPRVWLPAATPPPPPSHTHTHQWPLWGGGGGGGGGDRSSPPLCL